LCLDKGQDIQIAGSDTDGFQSRLKIDIGPCVTGDCYNETRRDERLNQIVVGAIWASQVFHEGEYDLSRVITQNAHYIFPEATLFARMKFDMLVY
jgi:hypothetical protein